MLYRLLVAALIAASASVTTAAPAVLDAGDALEARMAALEAKVNELEFVDKVKKLAEEHGVTEQRYDDWWNIKDRFAAWKNAKGPPAEELAKELKRAKKFYSSFG